MARTKKEEPYALGAVDMRLPEAFKRVLAMASKDIDGREATDGDTTDRERAELKRDGEAWAMIRDLAVGTCRMKKEELDG